LGAAVAEEVQPLTCPRKVAKLNVELSLRKIPNSNGSNELTQWEWVYEWF
jgi:hypothetical protein